MLIEMGRTFGAQEQYIKHIDYIILISKLG